MCIYKLYYIIICDGIWENMHSSNMRSCTFKYLIGKALRSKICRCSRSMQLQSLKSPGLSDMHNKFYESSKLKNWMRELYIHIFTNPVTYIATRAVR